MRAASVTIHLPEAVALTDVVLGEDAPGPAAERTADGQIWRWESSGLDEGDDLVARMQFPPITSATVAGLARPGRRRAGGEGRC